MQIAEGTKLGGYRVVRKIGEGGMGAVYEGVHERLQKRVAIKTLHEQFARDAGSVARFTREGRAASRIRHAHVIDVTDVGMQDGTPYLVMELLEGESLAGLLQRQGPLGPEGIADLGMPVCDALDAAHKAGIIHRDLKPENIFLAHARNGTDVHPMVLDFGISCIEDEVRTTKAAHFMGTPYYMSPEQAQSALLVDARSDQYSFGLVLFELTTGRRGLAGNSMLEIVHRVATQGAFRLTQVRPDLPPAFSAIIDRMTESDPNARFPSMHEVGAALLPFASARGVAMWGHAFSGMSTVPSPPSPGPTSGVVSLPSSFATRDAPSRPGGTNPANTPSFTNPSHPGISGAHLATDPTIDARHASVSRAPSQSPSLAPPARSPVLLAVIAIAAVAAAVGIAFLVGNTIARQERGTAPNAIPTTLVPPPSVTTPPPTTIAHAAIEIRVRALPSTADIVLDGTVVGTGTYSGSVAHDGIPHLLEVRAEGFVPHDIQFLDVAPVATVTLDAVPSHHHGPVVARHSEMTSNGLVEASPPPTGHVRTQGMATTTAGSGTGTPHDTSAAQAPGTGAIPPTTVAAPPPTTTAHTDWAAPPEDDELVPFGK